MAEAIRRGETDAALRIMFEILTGETIDQYPTRRDIHGETAIADGVTDKRVRLAVTIDGPVTQEVRAYDDRGYEIRDLPPGEYEVSGAVDSVYTYDEATLEQTIYQIESQHVTPTASTITIDPTETPIGRIVKAPDMTVDGLTLGGVVE